MVESLREDCGLIPSSHRSQSCLIRLPKILSTSKHSSPFSGQPLNSISVNVSQPVIPYSALKLYPRLLSLTALSTPSFPCACFQSQLPAQFLSFLPSLIFTKPYPIAASRLKRLILFDLVTSVASFLCSHATFRSHYFPLWTTLQTGILQVSYSVTTVPT